MKSTSASASSLNALACFAASRASSERARISAADFALIVAEAFSADSFALVAVASALFKASAMVAVFSSAGRAAICAFACATFSWTLSTTVEILSTVIEARSAPAGASVTFAASSAIFSLIFVARTVTTILSAAASLPEPEVDLTELMTIDTTESIAATEPLTATSICAAATSVSVAAASRLASS